MNIPICSSILRRFRRQAPAATGSVPAWDSASISDEWFRLHFDYAAGVVHEWLSYDMQIENLRLLDFGCGDGITDLGVALKSGPARLTGVDVNDSFRRLSSSAREQLGVGLPDNLDFQKIEPGQKLAARYDVDAIFSWSTFEHVERVHLKSVIEDLLNLLPEGGVFFLQIEPLYHSPYGSHLKRFIDVPWSHLLWDQEQLREAVMRYEGEIPEEDREDNLYQRSFEEYKEFIYGEYLKLNRLTAPELTDIFDGCGFDIIRQESLQVETEPPAELVDRYGAEVLTTNEIRLLMRKPAT